MDIAAVLSLLLYFETLMLAMGRLWLRLRSGHEQDTEPQVFVR